MATRIKESSINSVLTVLSLFCSYQEVVAVPGLDTPYACGNQRHSRVASVLCVIVGPPKLGITSRGPARC